ncbi:MAG: hypothetical protein HY699_21905 [Deltaproteobacteria bacterium]|nr:hypothetical protein [Deltaproteobacteria bacterium]
MREHLLPTTATTLDRAAVRGWLAVAVGSLLLAGLFAVLLVVGRMPGLAALFDDPQLFRRCLVVHVVLSLVVWFYAFLAALFLTVPCAQPSRRAGPASVLGGLGLLLLMAAAGLPAGQPLLSNYVPVIDHGLFLAGLIVLALGLVATFLDARLLPSAETASGFFPAPPAARVGLRAAAMAFLLAIITFTGSVASTPAGLAAAGYYELVFWGGGHVLQFASTAGMVSVWIMMLTAALGRAPLERAPAAVLFGLLVAPLLGAPLLAARGTLTPEYHRGFTLLMQWGVFPVVTVFILLCLRAVVRADRDGSLPPGGWRDPRLVVVGASAAMTLLGFVLGAMIRGANTMIPAHYHASIGAVTTVYMAAAYPLFAAVGSPLPTAAWRRLARWQPVLYAAGQSVFAIGFGLAGAHGMLRKTYGAEQQIRSLAAEIGMLVMGLGGAVAVASGLLFLAIVIACWRGRAPQWGVQKGKVAWQTNIRFSA